MPRRGLSAVAVPDGSQSSQKAGVDRRAEGADRGETDPRKDGELLKNPYVEIGKQRERGADGKMYDEHMKDENGLSQDREKG